MKTKNYKQELERGCTHRLSSYTRDRLHNVSYAPVYYNSYIRPFIENRSNFNNPVLKECCIAQTLLNSSSWVKFLGLKDVEMPLAMTAPLSRKQAQSLKKNVDKAVKLTANLVMHYRKKLSGDVLPYSVEGNELKRDVYRLAVKGLSQLQQQYASLLSKPGSMLEFSDSEKHEIVEPGCRLAAKVKFHKNPLAFMSEKNPEFDRREFDRGVVSADNEQEPRAIKP